MTHWVRAPGVLWRRTPRAVVLLAPATGSEPVTVDGSGVELWELLETPRTCAELAMQLALRYDAPADLIEQEIAPVVQLLAAAEFLEPAP